MPYSIVGNERAVLYRKLNNIPEEWGTAKRTLWFSETWEIHRLQVLLLHVILPQEKIFSAGEYLINAQGEDVVAGIRTPLQITLEGSRRWAKLQGISEEERD